MICFCCDQPEHERGSKCCVYEYQEMFPDGMEGVFDD